MKIEKGIGNMRTRDFLECMGNGKPIHQCEEDNDYIEDELNVDGIPLPSVKFVNNVKEVSN